MANQSIKLTARNGCGLPGKLIGASAYTYRYGEKKIPWKYRGLEKMKNKWEGIRPKQH